MSSTQTDSVSYKSLTKYWPTTDNNILFYADQTGSGYNREHVWPKSRASFYQKNGGCDLHHLRPADQTLNSTRKNYTMGYVNGVINGCSTANYGGRTVLWYSAGNDLDEVRENGQRDVARLHLRLGLGRGQGQDRAVLHGGGRQDLHLLEVRQHQDRGASGSGSYRRK